MPEPLGWRQAEILGAYDLALDSAVAGGMGGLARLGLGYAEREECFSFHGIANADEQDFLVEAFGVISRARAEGRAAGEKEAEEMRKRDAK